MSMYVGEGHPFSAHVLFSPGIGIGVYSYLHAYAWYHSSSRFQAKVLDISIATIAYDHSLDWNNGVE